MSAQLHRGTHMPPRALACRRAPTSTLTVVPDFSFDVADVLDLDGRHSGITLIGPPVETSGALSVG